jgi:hypothetical protein
MSLTNPIVHGVVSVVLFAIPMVLASNNPGLIRAEATKAAYPLTNAVAADAIPKAAEAHIPYKA